MGVTELKVGRFYRNDSGFEFRCEWVAPPRVNEHRTAVQAAGGIWGGERQVVELVLDAWDEVEEDSPAEEDCRQTLALGEFISAPDSVPAWFVLNLLRLLLEKC